MSKTPLSMVDAERLIDVKRTRVGLLLTLLVLGSLSFMTPLRPLDPSVHPPDPYHIHHLTLPGDDGFPLDATFYATPEKAPAVLLLHPCGGQRAEYERLAMHLALTGFNVLSFDFRGHGGSQPTEVFPVANFEKTPADIEAAFQFLIEQESVEAAHIGVVGASCSVAFAVDLARQHHNVTAMVGLSGHTKVDGKAFIRAAEELAILGVGSVDDWMAVKEEEGGDWRRLDAATSMSEVVGQSRHRFSKMITYQQAGHATAMFQHRKALELRMAAWLTEVLLLNL